MAAAKQSGLGRGLKALIKEPPAESAPPETPGTGIDRVPVARVRKSPWQPRRHFDEASLEDLVHSVRERGVLQPLLVRRVKDEYELIAGERRLRAAQLAEQDEVPVILMDVTDREALELALVENLQREDLNLIEEAEGYRALAEKFDMTQDRIAQRVGKARASVANALRLLALPDELKQMVAEGSLSAGHAKVLLGLEIEEEQKLLARRVVREGLSVRELERIAARASRPARKPRAARPDIPETHLRELSEKLHQHLGTSVRVQPSRTLANGRKVNGSIEIAYYSNEDLDRLLELLGLDDSL
jgi:ParB family chromosome partitioning protein